MNNVIKNSFYAFAWLTLIGLNNVALALDFWKDKANTISWSTKTADAVITQWVAFIVWFLYLVAVIVMIYGGFNILTAGWDEEKVKKGKTILMQAGAWLVVIFIAGSVIDWIISLLFGAGA
jgi:uncharacterized membrane protein